MNQDPSGPHHCIPPVSGNAITEVPEWANLNGPAMEEVDLLSTLPVQQWQTPLSPPRVQVMKRQRSSSTNNIQSFGQVYCSERAAVMQQTSSTAGEQNHRTTENSEEDMFESIGEEQVHCGSPDSVTDVSDSYQDPNRSEIARQMASIDEALDLHIWAPCYHKTFKDKGMKDLRSGLTFTRHTTQSMKTPPRLQLPTTMNLNGAMDLTSMGGLFPGQKATVLDRMTSVCSDGNQRIPVPSHLYRRAYQQPW